MAEGRESKGRAEGGDKRQMRALSHTYVHNIRGDEEAAYVNSSRHQNNFHQTAASPDKTGNFSTEVTLLLASHVFFLHYRCRRRWPDQQTRRACVGRERREGRNGDFCDEIGVPGEHCLGQETAAITGERGGQEETANAASKPNIRA